MYRSHRFLQSWADQGCPVGRLKKPCFLNHFGKNFFHPLEVVVLSHFVYEEADKDTQVCLCKTHPKFSIMLFYKTLFLRHKPRKGFVW